MDASTNITPEFLASLPPAFDLLRSGGSYITSAVLAKQVRADLKAAVTAGVFPIGTEFSVRTNRGGYSRSITVEIVSWAGGAVYCPDYMTMVMEAILTGKEPCWLQPRVSCYAPAFISARRDAERIANRHNYNRSQIEVDHFDVGYYLSVDSGHVETAVHVGLRCELSPAFASLRQSAIEAAAGLPKNLVKYLAPNGVGTAEEYTLRKLVEWAERAKGGAIVHERGRWLVRREARAAA